MNTIEHSKDGVNVICEDGSTYSAKAAILSVSLGVLQSNLITFEPELPVITQTTAILLFLQSNQRLQKRGVVCLIRSPKVLEYEYI